MSLVVNQAVRPASAPGALTQAAPTPTAGFSGRQRVLEPVSDRVRRDGKFFRLGSDKFYVKGVTYGPFTPNSAGEPLPEPGRVREDFEQMLDLGANCLRIYHIPPGWMMELAQQMGLWIFVDVSWPKNLEFIHDQKIAAFGKGDKDI